MQPQPLFYHLRDMPVVSFRIRESSWLARVAAWKLGVPSVALTIGRTIHLHRASRHALLQDRSWLRHELKHVEQFHKHGFLSFMGLYLVESVRHGYYGNRFEREARAAETDPAYDPLQACDRTGRGTFSPAAAGKAIPVVQTKKA